MAQTTEQATDNKKDQTEKLFEMMLKMRAEMEALRREREEEGLPDELLAKAWEAWEADILARKPSQEGSRGDVHQAMSHKDLILDLPFVHRDSTLTLGQVSARKVTVAMVTDWRGALQLRPLTKGPHKGEASSPSYRNRILASLRSLLSWRYGRENNPLRRMRIESVKGRGREGFFVDEDHLEEWLAHANPQYQRIARVAVSGGAMRLSEARLLMEHEVNWNPEERKITLPAGRVKNDVGRSFAISSKSFEVLQAMREEATVCRYEGCEVLNSPKMAPDHWRNHRHLFQHQAYSDGRAPSRRTMVNWGTDAGKRFIKAGGEGLGPKRERPSTHHLRHTGITWNTFKSRGDLHKVAKDAGHSSVKITMRYAHRMDEMMAEAAAAEDLSMKEALAQRLAELKESTRQAPQGATSARSRVRVKDGEGER